MKQKYKDYNFRAAALELIAKCNVVIAEIQAEGDTLTLRQLYYQLVAQAVFENEQRNYKRLGSILNDARLAGLVDWDAIEDRTRGLKGWSYTTSPEDMLQSAADTYLLNKWLPKFGQKYRPEVWVEKDALVGVVAKVAGDLEINYFSCRGYGSISEMREAAQRLAMYKARGQKPVVIHLGDHDPSGIDMTRDIKERLRLCGAYGVDVRRIALNMPQIEEYNPPPNPAKETDSRFVDYQALHGDESWELDSLPPRVIRQLIRDEVYSFRDVDKWKEAEREQEKERKTLVAVSERFDEVSEFLGVNVDDSDLEDDEAEDEDDAETED